jgi:hypothetical protein
MAKRGLLRIFIITLRVSRQHYLAISKPVFI